MPPPASFIEIDEIPFNQVVTQAMFNVANEQWFKYTAIVPIVIGFYTNSGGTFVPNTKVYEDDGTTLYGLDVTGDFGLRVALRVAGDYYIKIARSLGGASDFDFTFTADTRSLDTYLPDVGDLIINDDSEDFPATIINSVTGETLGFYSTVPAGEMGAILPSNISVWHDFYGQYHATNKEAVLSAILEHVASVQTGVDVQYRFATDITNNKFYVFDNGFELWTISPTGVVTDTGYFFPGDQPWMMAINEDGTKLYWANLDDDGIIHVLQLSDFTDLADLYTVPGWSANNDQFARTPNNHSGDMFVMPNGNVVTWYRKNSTSRYHLLVVSSAGALVLDFEFAADRLLNHLAYINGNSNFIYAWFYVDDFREIGVFGRLNLATGAVDQDSTIELFSQYSNMSGGTTMFGPSTSCTMLAAQIDSVIPGTPGAGIYVLTNGKTDDTIYTEAGSEDVEIPNPFAKTAYIGS